MAQHTDNTRTPVLLAWPRVSVYVKDVAVSKREHHQSGVRIWPEMGGDDVRREEGNGRKDGKKYACSERFKVTSKPLYSKRAMIPG
jgi:hypothetical protein